MSAAPDDVREAMGHIKCLVEFAYEQGYHELGYRPEAVVQKYIERRHDGFNQTWMENRSYLVMLHERANEVRKMHKALRRQRARIESIAAQLALVTAERDLALDQLQCEDSDERSELPLTNP